VVVVVNVDKDEELKVDQNTNAREERSTAPVMMDVLSVVIDVLV
jgi:hypothetical protein